MPNEFVGFESVPTVMLYRALIQAGAIADGQSSVASAPSRVSKGNYSYTASRLTKHTYVLLDFS
jgi:hypothetical protein